MYDTSTVASVPAGDRATNCLEFLIVDDVRSICNNIIRKVCLIDQLALLSVQVIIFVKSVQRCIALAQLLVEQNFPAICIHRGMPQEERWALFRTMNL